MSKYVKILRSGLLRSGLFAPESPLFGKHPQSNASTPRASKKRARDGLPKRKHGGQNPVCYDMILACLRNKHI